METCNPAVHAAIAQVAADVAEAMCYLHPRIVHRDLKSQASHAFVVQAGMVVLQAVGVVSWACPASIR